MNSDPIFDSGSEAIYALRTTAPGPSGRLPLDAAQLRAMPSGDLFGWTQNAGMGWAPSRMLGKQFLILSTQGGLRAPDGSPIALGYHTGHWEVGLLMEEAARVFSAEGAIPFAAYCSDPCDGRTNGTVGMLDSLPYRNDAAIIFRRLIRSLPTRRGVLGVATCDKGLPAMLMALAGTPDLPTILVPGGVTLLAEEAEDAGKVQTLGARFAREEITLDYAAEIGCRACGSPGGGCQFMGTAATSQVVAEALGLTLPHGALSPSGAEIWRDLARRSAHALLALERAGLTTRDLLTDDSIHNAMVTHAAVGGSTNLVLHVPAIAHAAGLRRPTVDDWTRINRAVPRLVDVLPNGPKHFATVQVFLAGGVPEVMLHLRDAGLLKLDARTVTGRTLGENLAWWEKSERRQRLREKLRELDGIDPDTVIMSPARAVERGLTSTITFLRGNLAPEGALVKSTAIAPERIGPDGVYHHEGPARVFTSEPSAIAAIKSGSVKAGDVMVLIGIGPAIGMPETYQITSALKHVKDGPQIALVTDGRFSGVSTGACIGHVSPEACAGGPIGKVRNGDRVRLHVDTRALTGSVDVVSVDEAEFAARPRHPELRRDEHVPADTRLWAALQNASGGTWGGCVYDAERIEGLLDRESVEYQRVVDALNTSNAFLDSLLENLPVSIYRKDTAGRFTFANERFCAVLGRPLAAILGRTDSDFSPPELAAKYRHDDEGVLATRRTFETVESHVSPDGEPRWIQIVKVVVLDAGGQVIGTQGMFWDVTAKKAAEAKVEQLHRQMLEISREAGMAEVATGVLHNVGNVLNSVNVSASLVVDRVRTSKVGSLSKIGTMLHEHAADLAAFLTDDLTGRKIPDYLATLAEHLSTEQRMMVEELEHLRQNVEHIKDVVAMQQRYATVAGMEEPVAVSDLVDDAIQMNAGAMTRHSISVVRQYNARPTLTLDRHKVMQILVNLLQNAKYACDESGRTDKSITLRIGADQAGVRIAVIDNGIGIPSENLTRIFSHGFTTRPGGHGFGLHNSALRAKELGGLLRAESDGPGRGATFVLEMPLSRVHAGRPSQPLP